MKTLKVLLLFILFDNFVATAQNPMYTNGGYNPAEKKVVRFDPVSQVQMGDIPFDRFFYIRFYAATEEMLPKYVFLFDKGETPSSTNQLRVFKLDRSKIKDDVFIDNGYFAVDVLMPPLDPNTYYQLQVVDGLYSIYADIFVKFSKGQVTDVSKIYDNTPLSSVVIRAKQANLQAYYNLHKASIDVLVAADSIKGLTDYLKANNTLTDGTGNTLALFEGSTGAYKFNSYQSKIETSSLLNLVADVGVVFCGFQQGFTTLTPYAGINYSFRSFDSDVPFHYLKKRVNFFDRVAIHAGITLNSLAKDRYRSNLLGTNNLLTGLSYKFSHVVSVNVGGLFFNKLDPNPLLDKKKVNVVPYAGLSINLKIKPALGQLANIFTK